MVLPELPAAPGPALDSQDVAGRTHKSEAIVLRSIRFSEADRILHLYTAHRGRIGAIAKGVRKTKSRFGARLEPLSHVELMLHEGSGELQTITGVELLRSHHATREDGYRLNVGLIGAEAMLRLFGEPEANERAFRRARALPRSARRGAGRGQPARARPARARVPAEAALARRLPAAPDELRRVRLERGARRLLGPRAGGAVCADHAREALRLSAEGLVAIEGMLSTPLVDSVGAPLSDRARRDALAVITTSYEEHGGFRLRTVSA